ncbi:uncharacterized protein TNCV_299881 [Trichonephila clavipes]|nr:uncharacterized protein TNCV_299881 [Trichonephila clavipes]
MKERCGWQNGMKLSLLTSHASVCNTTMVGFESGDTVERMLNSCVMHHHTGPALGIMVWDGIGYHSHSSSAHCRYFKQPVLHLRGVRASFPSLPSGLCHRDHISTGQCVTKRDMHCPKVFRQSPD